MTHNTTTLRDQLYTFDDAQLDALCQDHYPVVYNEFARGLRKGEKITLLLDHCTRHRQLDGLADLLATWQPPPPEPPEHETLDQRNRRIMLDKVQAFWVEGVLEQSIHGASLIELGMEIQPDAVTHPWDMVIQRPDRQDRTLPPGTPIIDVYDDMDRALLILGEPGSGKTTTLLELARDAIARARQDPNQPIPVVFNLSSWPGEKQPIAEWLEDELRARYNVPGKVSRAWLAADALLLLLDGLDELPPDRRASCVQALNRFRDEEEHGLMGIVVCSRTAGYESLATQLEFPGAVALQPLTSRQIDDYLDGAGAELQAVRATLQHDDTLQEMAQTPLFLSIMTLAYRGLTLADLRPLDSPAARRQHLFAAYVDHMFQHRQADERYTPEQTCRWLTWLAQKMIQHGQTIFLIERVQADWLSVRKLRWLYYVCVMLAAGVPIGLLVGWGGGLPLRLYGSPIAQAFGIGIGLAAGLTICLAIGRVFGLIGSLFVGSAFGIVFGIAFGMHNPLSVALTVGLAVGLATGTAFGSFGLFGERLTGLTVSSLERVRLVETLSWSWRKALLGLVVGLIAGFVFGFTTGQAIRGPIALSFGIAFGLAAGSVAGLLRGLRGSEIEVRTSPNQGIWRSARNAISVGAIVVLAVGLPIGVVTRSAWEGYKGIGSLTIGLGIGVTIGSAFGIATGLFFGGLAFIQHFILRSILCHNGHIPWNYVRFLDHAADLIFLRKVGGGYIFVHRLLMEYFASLESPTPTA